MVMPTLLILLIATLIRPNLIKLENLKRNNIFLSLVALVVTIIFWCFAMYGPSTTVIHHGTAITVMIPLLVAGTIFANANIPLYICGCSIQLIGIFSVYSSRLSIEGRLLFFITGALMLIVATFLSFYKKYSQLDKNRFNAIS
jgi:hypothetical protein